MLSIKNPPPYALVKIFSLGDIKYHITSSFRVCVYAYEGGVQVKAERVGTMIPKGSVLRHEFN